MRVYGRAIAWLAMLLIFGAAPAAPPTSRVALAIGERLGMLLPRLDSNGPSAYDATGNFWFIQAVGGTIASTPWRIYRGKTLDDIVFQYEFIPDQHWPRPHSDDTWWAEGLWIDPADGRWYVVMHTEFNYNKYSRRQRTGYSIDRMSTVALATSTNQGRNWNFAGDIISSDHPSDPGYWANQNYWRQGPGDPSLYVDSRYLYVYYNTRWNSRDDIDAIHAGVRVARCPINAKFAPGCWKKWYLGHWTSPGLGGHDSDVFNNDYSDTATVFWSESRHLYVAVTLGSYRLNAERKDEYNGYIATATSLDRQDWSRSIVALPPKYKGWYSWAVDPITHSRYVIETDLLRWCAGEYAASDGIVGLQCYRARLTDPPADPVTTMPRYPPESVDDYSPGWDRVRFPPQTAAPPR